LWYMFPTEKLTESFHDLYATWDIGWALKELGISDVCLFFFLAMIESRV
jgi:hypothetical protein